MHYPGEPNATYCLPLSSKETLYVRPHLAPISGKCLTVPQSAKKVVSDSLGLMDIATRLVNSVLNLPGGQVKFFRGFTSEEL